MASKVLIAHGDTTELQRLVVAFQAAGLVPVATPDGGDAFARFFEEEPQLVVCSSGLPVLAGRNFLSMIQSQAPNTHVVLLEPQAPAGAEPVNYPIFDEPVDVQALLALFPDLSYAAEVAPTPAALEPAAAAAREQALAILYRFQGTNSMLRLLDDAGVARLAGIADVQPRDADSLVIQQGEKGDGFYMLAEGQVRVTLAETGDQEVARIGPGEFFGEIALLSQEPRSASVWTTIPSLLLWFARTPSLRLLDDYPALREALSGIALQRTEENIWRALYDDSDVQRTLGELAESLEPPAQAAPLPPPAPIVADSVEEALTAATSNIDVTARIRRHPTPAAPRRFRRVRREIIYALGVTAFMGIALIAVSQLTPPDEVLAPEPEPPATAVVEPGAAEPTLAEPELTPSPAAEPVPTAAETEPAVETTPSPAVEPEPAAEPAPSPAVEPEVTPSPTPAAPSPERKALRRRLIQAEQDGRHAEALAAGLAMRERFDMDWEAQLNLGHAQRLTGAVADALATYLDFVAKYPTNVFADDARFWAAEMLLAQGNVAKARPLLQQVAADPKSNFRAAAEEKLTTLK